MLMSLNQYFQNFLWGILCFHLVANVCVAQRKHEKNNFRIVHNERAIKNSAVAIKLKFIRKYGGIRSNNYRYILYNPRAIALDSLGNLYILDSEEPFIKAFNKNGNFLKSFGQKGEGPGEFIMPAGIAFSKDGKLLIMDMRQHHITALSPNGDFLYRTILEKDEGCWPDFYPITDSQFLCGTSWGLRWAAPGEEYKEPVMKIVDSRGHFIRGFGEPKRYSDATMAKTANSVYFAIDSEENIWVSFCYQNRIEKFSSNGELLIRIDRDLPYHPTEEPKAIYFEKTGKVSSGVRLSRLNVVSTGVAIDYKNRVWVATFHRQPKYNSFGYMSVAEGETNYVNLEVYDQDGNLIQKLPCSEALSPLRKALYIAKERLFLLNDADASLSEYQIIN